MARRIHVSSLCPGEIVLDASQAHHVRDVLRLSVGSAVELFDDAGATASGIIASLDSDRVVVRVENIEQRVQTGELIVASAVPKGDRADWMIEKLSELGVTRFIPLQTERSVVHPTGMGKRDRWVRIATESAKQSRRAGVMQIDELTSLHRALDVLCDTGLWPVQNSAHTSESPSRQRISHGPEARVTANWYFSTTDDAVPAIELIGTQVDQLMLLIGPEGGWTESEIAMFKSHNLTGVKLTATILRVETAAIAAAAIAATLLVRR